MTRMSPSSGLRAPGSSPGAPSACPPAPHQPQDDACDCQGRRRARLAPAPYQPQGHLRACRGSAPLATGVHTHGRAWCGGATVARKGTAGRPVQGAQCRAPVQGRVTSPQDTLLRLSSRSCGAANWTGHRSRGERLWRAAHRRDQLPQRAKGAAALCASRAVVDDAAHTEAATSRGTCRPKPLWLGTLGHIPGDVHAAEACLATAAQQAWLTSQAACACACACGNLRSAEDAEMVHLK